MACSCKILILGHSLCRNLHTRVREGGAQFDPKFKLSGSPEVRFRGVSGLTVPRLKREELQTVDRFRPDVVFLQIGGNDISPETDPELLAFEIIALASLLQGRYGVRRVFIGQIMPRFEANGSARRLHWIARRPVHYVTQYRACAEATNSVLEKETARYDGITFWRHAKFTMAQDNNCRRRFRSDGVHHSESGLYHFYKSIRGALTGTCLTSPNRH
ncbi:hypothetical protein BaRGS_00016448 [Batillaria attramentaria]|uniref:SGNH hydrolase-type esterase domain-containing protein n=1 Tax=Batillaria attramentaria TaxID=370345 RepID=A0ABD0KZB5_9CAEN